MAYKNGCDSLSGWDITHIGTGVTMTVTSNGYCGNCFDLSQPNTTSQENSARFDFSGNNYRIFSFKFTISTNTAGETCIAHVWSTSFGANLFEVRIVQSTTQFKMKLSNAAGTPTTVTGTTLLNVGTPYKVTVEVTDTTLNLWLDDTVSGAECSITGLSQTGLNIGPVAIGEYFANNVNGHVYFDDIYADIALGTAPSTISSKISDTWSGWKQRYISNDGTNSAAVVRPKNEGNGTTDGADIVSEGMGYGLMLAVQNNDQTTFDTLERWCFSNLDRRNNGGLSSNLNLMAWHYNPAGSSHSVLDWNNAADADLHRCLALLWAQARVDRGDWSSGTLSYSYMTRALAIASDFKSGMFNQFGSKQYLCADQTQKGVNPFEMATSYIQTVCFRQLKRITDDAFWQWAIEGAYDAYNQSQSSVLDVATSAYYPPDWNFFNTSTGLVATDTNSGRESKYNYNAIRTPFWMWLEWQWYGESRWQSLLSGNYYTSLNTYYGANTSKLAAQYKHDGSLDGSAYEKTQMYACDYFVFHAAGSASAPTIYSNKVTNTYVQHQAGSYWSDNASTTGVSLYFNNSWTILSIMAKEGTLTNLTTSPQLIGATSISNITSLTF